VEEVKMGRNRSSNVHSTEVPENVAFEPEEDNSDVGGVLGGESGEEVEVEIKRGKVKKVKEVKVDKNAVKRQLMLEAVEEGARVVEASKKGMTAGKMIMEGAFAKINLYINSIYSGYSTGLIVLGSAGLGKSFTVRKALAELSIDYEVVEAYITPPELFLALYRCRKKGKVLLLDDCHKLLEDARCLSYLKCALASTQEMNKNRVVTNATQKPLQDPVSGMYVPNSYLFEGNVIILTNVLNEKNSHIKAVMSRLDHVKLVFTDEQKFKIMEEIIKLSYSLTTEDERRYCLRYLEENSKMCSRDVINFRTLKKLFDYYMCCKASNKGVFDASNFDVMGRGLLDLDNDGVDDADIICAKMLEGRVDLVTRKDKEREFIKLQGKSHATYHRTLERAGITGRD
jgi:hypothetical protein